MKPTVLVVDDEKTFRIVAEEALSSEGFTVTTAASGQAGLTAWQRDPCDLVILDRHLPDTDGIAVLEAIVKEAGERGLDTLVVIATAYADVTSAVQAVKLGAFDYLSKPLQLPELVVTVRKALEAKRLRAEVRQLKGQLAGRAHAVLGDFVAGSSSAMASVVDMVDKVAQSPDTTVLVQGESGTGKEHIADLIHRRTPGRGAGPFVEINCASVPESLLESELFGHERGAFTDAKGSKRGLFEEADGGTLLLDEVGEMPMGTQAKLLKVLEEMTFRRLGGTRDLTVSVRVVAATNKDLAVEVERGALRLDLYHRLDVFHIHVPPLRERREDVMPLATHFLARFAARLRKTAARFAPETERLLLAYDYPGNVRELRNLVERAVILSTGAVIEPVCIVISGPALAGAASGAAFFSVDLADGRPPSLDGKEGRAGRGA
ncbi:MAG TPA: sigma-54 dependent transcriptional regulator, partial [Polyangia bacterium]|nr:sigma-54 dependent transcriptional regulator [Polyangia bacterium]